jgi:hypothetical protein
MHVSFYKSQLTIYLHIPFIDYPGNYFPATQNNREITLYLVNGPIYCAATRTLIKLNSALSPILNTLLTAATQRTG